MFIFSPKLIQKIGSVNHNHYCIITHGGKIITTGYNRPYLVMFKGKEYMRHAECDALLKLPHKYKNKKIRMYVIRKEYKNSKPCLNCLEFISDFNVKNIYYSDQGCLWDEPLSTISTKHVSFGSPRGHACPALVAEN